jgi:hypothetical protein
MNDDRQETALPAAEWIHKSWGAIFPASFQFVQREMPVYGTIISPNRSESMGYRVDFFARHKSKPYIIECDLNDSAKDVWHVFKVFGYRGAYCLDRGVNPKKVGLMVFIASHVYNHRVRNIFAFCGIEFCVFRKTEEGWKLVKSSLWR